MNEITIYDLLNKLRPGHVAMDANGIWWWYEDEPIVDGNGWAQCDDLDLGELFCLNSAFKIAPFEGDWKNSLMECGKESTQRTTTGNV